MSTGKLYNQFPRLNQPTAEYSFSHRELIETDPETATGDRMMMKCNAL